MVNDGGSYTFGREGDEEGVCAACRGYTGLVPIQERRKYQNTSLSDPPPNENGSTLPLMTRSSLDQTKNTEEGKGFVG